MKTVTCKWCGESFEIEPTFSARPFRCPSCGKESALISLLSKPNPNAIALTVEAGNAATLRIQQHTVVYYYPCDRGHAKASGVLVSIGDRCFVATAAHSIPDEPSGKLRIMRRLSDDSVCPKIVNAWKSRSKVRDVGLVELAPESLVGFVGEPVTLDRVADLGPGRPNSSCWLMGYPGAIAEPVENRPDTEGYTAVGYMCNPIAIDAWNAIESEFDVFVPDPSIHALFFYSAAEPGHIGLNRDLISSLPEPLGMSGGGCWQQLRPAQIWSPDCLCLFALISDWPLRAPGVDSSWPQRTDFLWAIQIVYWLQLVAETFPELRDELCDRFPRLKTLPPIDT